jgi:hypothetical protein
MYLFNIVPGEPVQCQFNTKQACPLCGRPLGDKPLVRYIKSRADETFTAHAGCADEEERNNMAGLDSCPGGKVLSVEAPRD